jgi:AcrR family transcriptional regulator
VEERRPYNSPLRQQQVAATRERIVAAASTLVHGFEGWDWRELTVRAVAKEAGVSERTVYRHFADEGALRDAVMERLQEEAGVDLDEVTLERFADHAAGVFEYLASFPVRTPAVREPTFESVDERRRAALLAAVDPATPGWSAADRRLAAAVLDVLWTVETYERLTSAWGLEPEQAARAARWVIGLVEQAIGDGRRPPRRG